MILKKRGYLKGFSKNLQTSLLRQTLAEKNGITINEVVTFEHPYIAKKHMEALVDNTYKSTRSE